MTFNMKTGTLAAFPVQRLWDEKRPRGCSIQVLFFPESDSGALQCLPREAVHFFLWRVSAWLRQELMHKSAIAVSPLALWECDSLFKDPKVHLFGSVSKTLEFYDRRRRKNITGLWQLLANRIQSLCQVRLFLR